MPDRYPPLVPQHPTPTADGELIAYLAELVELERGLADAVGRAAAPADGDDRADRLERLSGHTSRAIESLSEQLSGLGASAPTADETRELLPHGADEVGRADGADAMDRLLEADQAHVLERYGAALAHEGAPPEVSEQLQQLRSDLAQWPSDQTVANG